MSNKQGYKRGFFRKGKARNELIADQHHDIFEKWSVKKDKIAYLNEDNVNIMRPTAAEHAQYVKRLYARKLDDVKTKQAKYTQLANEPNSEAFKRKRKALWDAADPGVRGPIENFNDSTKKWYEQRVKDLKSRREGIEFWYANQMGEHMDGMADNAFITDFLRWTNGIGRPEDHAKTPWGNKPVALDFPDVRAFMDQIFEVRQEIQTDLLKLVNNGPRNLNDFFKYYKYIIRGDPLDDVDFLRLFQLYVDGGDPDPAYGNKFYANLQREYTAYNETVTDPDKRMVDRQFAMMNRSNMTGRINDLEADPSYKKLNWSEVDDPKKKEQERLFIGHPASYKTPFARPGEGGGVEEEDNLMTTMAPDDPGYASTAQIEMDRANREQQIIDTLSKLTLAIDGLQYSGGTKPIGEPPASNIQVKTEPPDEPVEEPMEEREEESEKERTERYQKRLDAEQREIEELKRQYQAPKMNTITPKREIIFQEPDDKGGVAYSGEEAVRRINKAIHDHNENIDKVYGPSPDRHMSVWEPEIDQPEPELGFEPEPELVDTNTIRDEMLEKREQQRLDMVLSYSLDRSQENINKIRKDAGQLNKEITETNKKYGLKIPILQVTDIPGYKPPEPFKPQPEPDPLPPTPPLPKPKVLPPKPTTEYSRKMNEMERINRQLGGLNALLSSPGTPKNQIPGFEKNKETILKRKEQLENELEAIIEVTRPQSPSESTPGPYFERPYAKFKAERVEDWSESDKILLDEYERQLRQIEQELKTVERESRIDALKTHKTRAEEAIVGLMEDYRIEPNTPPVTPQEKSTPKTSLKGLISATESPELPKKRTPKPTKLFGDQTTTDIIKDLGDIDDDDPEAEKEAFKKIKEAEKEAEKEAINLDDEDDDEDEDEEPDEEDLSFVVEDVSEEEDLVAEYLEYEKAIEEANEEESEEDSSEDIEPQLEEDEEGPTEKKEAKARRIAASVQQGRPRKLVWNGSAFAREFAAKAKEEFNIEDGDKINDLYNIYVKNREDEEAERKAEERRKKSKQSTLAPIPTKQGYYSEPTVDGIATLKATLKGQGNKPGKNPKTNEILLTRDEKGKSVPHTIENLVHDISKAADEDKEYNLELSVEGYDAGAIEEIKRRLRRMIDTAIVDYTRSLPNLTSIEKRRKQDRMADKFELW